MKKFWLGCSAKKEVWEYTQKPSHFQQHFKLIFKGVLEVFTFITLHKKTSIVVYGAPQEIAYHIHSFVRRLELYIANLSKNTLLYVMLL